MNLDMLQSITDSKLSKIIGDNRVRAAVLLVHDVVRVNLKMSDTLVETCAKVLP